MPKPLIHAQDDVRRWGGDVSDYLPIHDLLDSSKSVIPTSVHRALTHQSWFLFILEKVFGQFITNSDGRKVSVRDIGEQHILMDFRNKFIPTPQDYLANIIIEDWMVNGRANSVPPSIRENVGNFYRKQKKVKRKDIEIVDNKEDESEPVKAAVAADPTSPLTEKIVELTAEVERLEKEVVAKDRQIALLTIQLEYEKNNSHPIWPREPKPLPWYPEPKPYKDPYTDPWGRPTVLD